MNSTVSIIVPVLNEIEHIHNFILSIITQDYRPIELILIDGGSTDGTLEIINSIDPNNTDKTFKLIVIPETGINRSPANAKNIGLNIASGEYILIIDSDTVFFRNNTLSNAILEMEYDNPILIEFGPIINTELEQFISSVSNPGGVILYHHNFIKNIRFNPKLGFGEDRVFQYELFGNLDHAGKISTSKIGRHYPHTLDEYAKQNKWYGRTILNYLKIAAKTNRKDFIEQVIFILYNQIVIIFPPSCLIKISKYSNINCKHTYRYGIFSKIWYSYYASFFFIKGMCNYFIQSFKNIW